MFDAAKNVNKGHDLIQTHLERFSLNKKAPPYHAALMNDIAGLRKYKFRSEMWNGSEAHMNLTSDEAVAKESKERVAKRKDAERYAHFHNQDLMTQKELYRTHQLFVLKMFRRVANRNHMYVALMNREAFMDHVREKMILKWDESQRHAQLAEYRVQGMSPGGLPLATHNLAADSQAELRMLAKTKATINPEAINSIERLLASTALQAATSLNTGPAENAASNHMKSTPNRPGVDSVSKPAKSKAS